MPDSAPSPHQSCLIATVKDEAPWLLEWVAHNRAIGFDRIVVASNDCTDGTDRMLDRLEALGQLVHVPNPQPFEHKVAQLSAYARIRRRPEVATAEWIMPLDSDEFLNIHHGSGTVADLIAAQSGDTDAISVCWRVFGDSGLDGIPDAPITAKLTKAAIPETNRYFVKVLFRNHDRFPIIRAHGPHVLGGKGKPVRFRCRMATAAGLPLAEDLLTTPGAQYNRPPPEGRSWDGAQINHYMIRTKAAFRLKKLRGNALSQDIGEQRYTAEVLERFNANDEEDLTLQRTAPAREAIREDLLGDPELFALHTAALEEARAKVARLEPVEPPASPRAKPGGSLLRRFLGTR